MKTIKIKNKSKSFAIPFHLRLREALLIVTGAVSLFLLLSLFTFTSSDPAWFQVFQSKAVLNAGGKGGAFLASLLIAIFGYLAFILPLMLFYGAWLYFSYRDELDAEYFAYFKMLRAAGFFFHFNSWLRLGQFTLVDGLGLIHRWGNDWPPGSIRYDSFFKCYRR